MNEVSLVLLLVHDGMELIEALYDVTSEPGFKVGGYPMPSLVFCNVSCRVFG